MRYSNDLRNKAINLVVNGKEQSEVADLLNIDKSTIYRWYKRYKELGSPNYFEGYKTGRRSKISDINLLKREINKRPDISLHELASRMNVSFMAIHRKLKKLGYSFKKSHGYTKSEIKNNE